MNVYILESSEDTASYGASNSLNVLEEKFGDAKEIGDKADFHTSLLLETPLLAFLVSQAMVDKLGDLLRKNGELYPCPIQTSKPCYH